MHNERPLDCKTQLPTTSKGAVLDKHVEHFPPTASFTAPKFQFIRLLIPLLQHLCEHGDFTGSVFTVYIYISYIYGVYIYSIHTVYLSPL